MPSAAQNGFQFQQQIDFFRQKTNLPTSTWTDILQQEHDRSFVVAGALRDDLLTDFRGAVDKAISDGTTLEEFRKDFDSIVAKHGWTYNGGRNWRSRVIYETNLLTSYSAGRWSQIQDTKATRPFVLYRHNDSVRHPRLQHILWDGLVLPIDSLWLATHWPPNGWGCRCFIESLSKRDLTRLGKQGPDTPPPSNDVDVQVGIRGPNPRTVKTPEGVDPGFGYTPGRSLSAERASEALDAEAAASSKLWRPEVTSDWQTLGRPEAVPLDATSSSLSAPASSIEEAADQLAEALGERSRLFDVKGLPVMIDADALAAHLGDDLSRSSYFPLLVDALSDPFEVWVSQEINEDTGDVRLRARVIKAFQLGRGRGLLVVADASKGYFRGWTIIPTSQLNYLQKQRVGVLLYGR